MSKDMYIYIIYAIHYIYHYVHVLCTYISTYVHCQPNTGWPFVETQGMKLYMDIMGIHSHIPY